MNRIIKLCMVLVVGLSYVCTTFPSHAGIGSKIKKTAKKGAEKTNDTVHKGANKAKDTASKGAEKTNDTVHKGANKGKSTAQQAPKHVQGIVDEEKAVFKQIF